MKCEGSHSVVLVSLTGEGIACSRDCSEIAHDNCVFAKIGLNKSHFLTSGVLPCLLSAPFLLL